MTVILTKTVTYLKIRPENLKITVILRVYVLTHLIYHIQSVIYIKV